ncbi:MAG: T9SS type A sorting domain-containing protein [Sphingobacteriales bacterium]|nr:MAG: T9SS type A sorting domain-containing protein [Sphingobacteriales bacterium]
MWYFQLKTKLRAIGVFALAASLFQSSPAQAQANNHPFNCGADVNWEMKAKENPALLMKRQEVLQTAMRYENARQKDGQEEVRIIPVVFHIIHQYGSENINKQRILDQLNTLNETFGGRNKDTSGVRKDYKYLIANSKVEFRLATKDPNGNCTDGIVRVYSAQTNNADDNVKAVSNWEPKNYLNIWVVNSITNFGQAGTILGYAQFPWDPSNSTDGIIVRADQVSAGNKTLTHEIGHYLGLFHTFQDGCGSSCASSGDYICDTPPSAGPTQGCPGATYNSCSSDVPNLPDMTENFMDYSTCARMFSLGQKARMDGVFSSTKRAYLVSEANLIATGVADGTAGQCKPIADFYATQYVICEGGSINFKDNTFNAAPNSYQWSFQGGNPALSSTKDPVIKFEKAGSYEVSLEVSNTAGNSKAERKALITVLPSVSDIKSPLAQDFESFNTTTSGYAFSTDANGLKWTINAGAAAGGTKSLYLNNLKAQELETYSVTLPAVDMTTSSTKKLTYSLAYAQVLSNSNDELRVQVSTDCGQNFSTVSYKYGSKLATTTELKTTAFKPTAAEWRTESIDLNSYKNTKNLIIRFMLKNRNGNNIYIDNLNIGEGFATAIEPNHFSGNAHMQLYPNPSYGNFSLRIATAEKNATMEVFDASGKQLAVLQNLTFENDQALYFTKNMLNIQSGGVYLIKLHTATASYVEKLIISK